MRPSSAARTKTAGQAGGVRGAQARASRVDTLADELKQHVKTRLAPFKYPRLVEFLEELPKTATGKIQRFKLRAPPPAS